MHAAKRRMVKGFTLLEMMLVVVIIGLLATVAVINLAGQSDRARRGATVASLRTISSALTSYYTASGSYPLTLTALVPAEMPKLARDGWKEDFVYYPSSADPARPYSLFSKGPDKLPNTPDDVSVWTMDEGN